MPKILPFVQQPTHMLRIMKKARAELCAVEFDRSLALRELGCTMVGVVISTMQDVGG